MADSKWKILELRDTLFRACHLVEELEEVELLADSIGNLKEIKPLIDKAINRTQRIFRRE